MKKLMSIALLSCALALTLHAQVPITVVNGGSFQANAPLAPGSYAQVWGDFAGFPTADGDLAQLPLATALENVEVQVNGVASPLYAVRNVVCAFTVPQAATAGQHTIQVLQNGQVIGEGVINIVDAFPGIFFARLADGTDVGGVKRTTDYADALEATPASRGGAIAIALTGQGTDVANPVGDGDAPAGAESTTNVQPRVFIAGVEAQVIFSGLYPFFPGLWQINAVIPDEAFISGPVPLVVTMNGIPSNQVIFWVAE